MACRLAWPDESWCGWPEMRAEGCLMKLAEATFLAGSEKKMKKRCEEAHRRNNQSAWRESYSLENGYLRLGEEKWNERKRRRRSIERRERETPTEKLKWNSEEERNVWQRRENREMYEAEKRRNEAISVSWSWETSWQRGLRSWILVTLAGHLLLYMQKLSETREESWAIQ